MKKILVAALDKNQLIGRGNDLPWHLPADLKHFKKLTENQSVLMGKNTFLSILKRLGKPLPNRRNIVLSHSLLPKDFPGAEILPHLEALQKINNPPPELYIIGGSSIYEALLPHADAMVLTHIDAAFEGDAYFPPINWHEWTIEKQVHHAINQNNSTPFKVVYYRRSATNRTRDH